jgi:hypothetical protein
MFCMIQCGSSTPYLDTPTDTCGIRIHHPYLFSVQYLYDYQANVTFSNIVLLWLELLVFSDC